MTHDELAYLASSKLYAFPLLASGNKNPKHIKFIANLIQTELQKETDKERLIIVTLPPRHGKTELIGVHAPAWILGNYPTKRIIMMSYGADLADSSSGKARDLFQKWGPILWGVNPNKSRFNRSAWDTELLGGEISAGLGGAVTGFGADVLIIDDYVKGWEEAESNLMREKVWQSWQSVASTRLHPGAIVIMLATRWHDDDLIGRILKQKEEEGEDFPFETTYVSLPAIAEENDLLGRQEGEALWPSRFNRESLERKKKIVGSYWWSSLYQCSPTARGGSLFKSDNFRYYDRDTRNGDYLCYREGEENPIRVNPLSLRKQVFVDPAIEIKKINDPTGVSAWGYSPLHKIWILLDILTERIEHTKVLDRLKTFAYRHKINNIGIENEKLGKVLVKQSAGNDSIAGYKIAFKEIPIKGMDKYARATPMANYIENERVFFPRSAPWLANYEDELVKFPNAAHDECVDVTAYAVEMEGDMTVAEALRGRN